MNLNCDNFKTKVLHNLMSGFSKNIDEAKRFEKYLAVSKAVMELIAINWKNTRNTYKNIRQVYYLSLEFLIGRSLGNNLLNLGIYNNVKETLNELGIKLNLIEDACEDAGLGNGGLGRLAACFLDSCATICLPVTGYGIRYKYGIFKQEFVNGEQVELPDNWQKYGDPWSVRRDDLSVTVEFGDGNINAVPYDMPVVGYSTKNINTLRLWQAEPIIGFDFKYFNNQEYSKALNKKNQADCISLILYPNDTKDSGKILRIKQQYFFVSASLQDSY